MPDSAGLEKLYSFPFCAMGSSCTLHLYSARGEEIEETAQYAISEVLRIETRYSRYRSESVLSGINRAAENGGSIGVDEETGGLLDYAFSCYQKSNGLFDITSGLLRKAPYPHLYSGCTCRALATPDHQQKPQGKYAGIQDKRQRRPYLEKETGEKRAAYGRNRKNR